MIEFGHATHAGLRHTHNEDTYWADPALGLFMIADGMGGQGRGAVAAAIARETLVEAAQTGRDPDIAMRDAGSAIAKHTSGAAGSLPMGAAIAVLQLDAGRYRGANVGDCDLRLWQAGSFVCATGDGQPDAAADADPPPADQASAPPRHHRATQALGITPAQDLYAAPMTGSTERGMQFLLYSAGLSAAVADPGIAAVLARIDLAAQECVDHLLLAALDAGVREDVTVLLVRIT